MCNQHHSNYVHVFKQPIATSKLEAIQARNKRWKTSLMWEVSISTAFETDDDAAARRNAIHTATAVAATTPIDTTNHVRSI